MIIKEVKVPLMNGVSERKQILGKFFTTPEFVSRDVYETLGDNALLLFSFEYLKTARSIRSFFGRPTFFNTWALGGKFDGRGFRDAREDTGSQTSTHRLALAGDCEVNGIHAEEVRETIIKNPDAFPYIRRMEIGVPWVHWDLKETGMEEIYLFNP